MKLPPHIEVRSDVMRGKPCLKGTLIPVYLVLEKLGGGESADEILAASPELKKEHSTASLEYGSALANEEIESLALADLNSGAPLKFDLDSGKRSTRFSMRS